MVEEKRFLMYPSDRELILRSKINIGWSVHSHRVFHRLETLNDCELEFILQVISRAQEIEISEQQRIGGLVERLENIKKNTLENGPRSCAMCGVPFGSLRSSVFTCYDCRKSVCNKCCVDTYSVAHDPCMLCKICAEDRELWKKSGGWFYGSLPIYAKPIATKSSASPNFNRATWEHRKPEIVRLESFEAAENENSGERFLKSSWANLSTQTGNDNEMKSLEDLKVTTNVFGCTDSGFLTPMNDNMRRKVSLQHLAAPEANLNLLSMSSMSTSCPSLVPHQIVKNVTSYQNSAMLEFALMYNSKGQVLQCTIYSVKGLNAEDKDEEMIYVKIYMIPFSKKMNVLRTKSSRKDSSVEFNETLVFSKIRQEKLKKRILRFQVVEEDSFDAHITGEVDVELNDLKALELKFFKMSLKKNNSEMVETAGCGWILLSVRYSPEVHALILRVIRCSDLLSNNKAGQLNSFVRVKLLPEFGGMKNETTVRHKTLNPTFNEEFTFHLSPMEMKSKSLMISVLEKTGKQNRCIGHVVLGIQARGEMLQHWLEVLKKPKTSVEKWHALLKETNYTM